MNVNGLKGIIKRIPILEEFLRKTIAFVPFGYRKLDDNFWSFYQFLFEMDRKTPAQVEAYQLRRLQEIVGKSYRESPFYKKKFDTAGFHPDQLKQLSDIIKIPPLSKEEVRQFADEMVLNSVNKKNLIPGFTSGTTGTALKLYYDQNIDSKEWASICYQWKRVGYEPGDGRIEFRGFIGKNVDYIFMPDVKILRVNIVKMSDKNIEKIIKKIESTGYQFLHGYPSAIWKLSNLLKKRNLKLQPKAIMMASEVLYDWQLLGIKEVFSCPLTVHYGQAEKVALAAWSEDQRYHFVPAYGYVERDSETNTLLATSLINEVMPLIRYRLSDCIEGFKMPENSTCGRTLFPVVDKILGREEDNTFDDRGNIIPPALVTFPFKQLQYIDAVRIIQVAVGQLILVIETQFEENFAPLQRELLEMKRNLMSIYGQTTQIDVSLTTKIPMSQSGKFRWIECQIHD